MLKPGDHLAKAFQAAVAAALQMMRVHAEAEHAAGFTETLQNRI
jgi:hypothetical protein